jgi:hypothetical protein
MPLAHAVAGSTFDSDSAAGLISRAARERWRLPAIRGRAELDRSSPIPTSSMPARVRYASCDERRKMPITNPLPRRLRGLSMALSMKRCHIWADPTAQTPTPTPWRQPGADTPACDRPQTFDPPVESSWHPRGRETADGLVGAQRMIQDLADELADSGSFGRGEDLPDVRARSVPTWAACPVMWSAPCGRPATLRARRAGAGGGGLERS